MSKNSYIFPQTVLVNNKSYGQIKCFNTNDLVCSIIINGHIWEDRLYNDIFKKYIKDNITIIDCGTFIGSHTILFSNINKNNNIIGFEMMPEHYKLLIDNINLNKLNNVLVFNGALDEKLGSIEVPYVDYSTKNTNYGATSLKSNKSAIKVPTFTLDYIMPFISPDKPVQFIKIDVEGHEIKCLNGAKSLIEKYKPLILIEIWQHEYNNFIKSEIWKHLEQNLKYKLKHINGDDYLLYIPGQFDDLV
jgi:FkbM family methyltransferase